MEWKDEGIILGTRRHGETSVILELMTRSHGRHLGLVRGGRSRRKQPFLQPGNSVEAMWRARLDEHLGHFTVEPIAERASRLMENAAGIYAVQILAALLRLLPERDPHPELHDALAASLEAVASPEAAAEVAVRFELAVLNELGFGLDLARCAATGATDNLAFVSPKTGRAVSREAGAAYEAKLLPLPAFLLRRGETDTTEADFRQAFALTGYFLHRHVYEPRGIAEPAARERLIALVASAVPATSGSLESATAPR
jgi:DNA repair protein RecO (recombination protein O)